MIYLLLQYLFSTDGRHYGFEQPIFRGLLACLTAFLVILLMGPPVIRYLVKRKIGDNPEFDHARYNEMSRHKANVPTMGGIMISCAIAIGVVLWADVRNFYVVMSYVCLFWLAALGSVDDWLKLTARIRGETRDGLKSYQKFLFQVGLGVVLAVFIYRHGRDAGQGHVGTMFDIFNLPFVKFDPATPIHLHLYVFAAMTVVVITGTSNAVNLTDGMDGLAAGCVTLACIVFMVLAEIAGNPDHAGYLLMPHVAGSGELSVVCGAMTGACLGFLWYNCPPAQVFMGDTGSLPLGGLIGYVAIVIRQELMLLIVGGVFVLEAISVIIQVSYFKRTKRLLGEGKRFFLMAPLHHHFHLKGWTETQVVARFWLLAILFAVVALVTVKLR